MSAWCRASFTPAIDDVLSKYAAAESPPRFRRLYTRYFMTSPSARPGVSMLMKCVRTLLVVVCDYTHATALSTLYALRKAVDEIRPARADI